MRNCQRLDCVAIAAMAAVRTHKHRPGAIRVRRAGSRKARSRPARRIPARQFGPPPALPERAHWRQQHVGHVSARPAPSRARRLSRHSTSPSSSSSHEHDVAQLDRPSPSPTTSSSGTSTSPSVEPARAHVAQLVEQHEQHVAQLDDVVRHGSSTYSSGTTSGSDMSSSSRARAPACRPQLRSVADHGDRASGRFFIGSMIGSSVGRAGAHRLGDGPMRAARQAQVSLPGSER
jgi:hypothetical protein